MVPPISVSGLWSWWNYWRQWNWNCVDDPPPPLICRFILYLDWVFPVCRGFREAEGWWKENISKQKIKGRGFLARQLVYSELDPEIQLRDVQRCDLDNKSAGKEVISQEKGHKTTVLLVVWCQEVSLGGLCFPWEMLSVGGDLAAVPCFSALKYFVYIL